MNINLKLSGAAEQAISDMITRGYATSKTEAIRIAVLDYRQHHLSDENSEMTKRDIEDLETALEEYKCKKTIPLEEV